jgi:hypothetical protein
MSPKLIGSLLLRTNDIAKQPDGVVDGPAVTSKHGTINDHRSDFTFASVPIRQVVGEDIWATHKTVVLRCSQFSFYVQTNQTNNSERAVVVMMSGHSPANKEYRSSGTQYVASYLVCRKDSNLATLTVGDEKSLEYVDQRITLNSDFLDLRFQHTLMTAFGAGQTVLPVSPNPVSFPHALFHFCIYTED